MLQKFVVIILLIKLDRHHNQYVEANQLITARINQDINEHAKLPVICLENPEGNHDVCIFDDTNITEPHYPDYPELEKPAKPVWQKCIHRHFHLFTATDSQYYINWIEAVVPDKTWTDARNFCRERCMELVSLETKAENELLKDLTKEVLLDGFWTSGRLCDFKGCEFYRSPFMWPRNENGWFWIGTGVRIPPYYDVERTDWYRGNNGPRQPDNGAYSKTGENEACLAAILDGSVAWHDLLCTERLPFICEANDQLWKIAKDEEELFHFGN